MVGYLFFQFAGGFAVADIVVWIAETSYLGDLVFDQFITAIAGEVSDCMRGYIRGVPALNGTHQVIVYISMAGNGGPIFLLLITNIIYIVFYSLLGKSPLKFNGS